MTEYPAKRPSEMEPVHPGEILREEVLPALELTIAEAAEELGVPEAALEPILAGRSRVSPEMAVRLGKFCGNGAAFWLRLQAAHDLWHAERRLRDEVGKIPSHAVA